MRINPDKILLSFAALAFIALGRPLYGQQGYTPAGPEYYAMSREDMVKR